MTSMTPTPFYSPGPNTSTFARDWGEHKMAPPLSKAVWKLLKEANKHTPPI